MALVRVAEECRGGYLAMHDAPRPDRGIADDATHEPGVRAYPEGAFEPHAGLDLDATLEDDWPLARVEHDAGFDRRFAQRDPRGVAQHDRACRHRVGVAEHRPSLPHQMRAGPELAERPDPGERHPRRTGIGIEQIERVCHRLCTKAFSLSGRPVGMTSVCPLARTTTMSSMPTTASSSLSAQITEFLTSSPSVTFPTVTLPCASRRRTRSSASHDPISSQAKVPVTTASRGVRSSTATSTATGVTAAKKRGASPFVRAAHPGASSSAYAPASPRKRAALHANNPLFQSAPPRRSRAARVGLGFSMNRFA